MNIASRIPRQFGQILCAGLLGFAALSPAHAFTPTEGNVVLGDATFAFNDAGHLIIHAADGSIIEWDSFDILPNEVVQFVMANASDAVLNRVTGNTPSQILGTLASNGQVYLINPNGIVFGGNAQVDVGGLVASTLDVNNPDFVDGGPLAFHGVGNGNIVQNGSIRAIDGSVVLIAPQVNNNGHVSAIGGQVLLIGSDRVLLMDRANPAVGIELDRTGVVHQDGTIEVGDGLAMLAGQTITASGLISANSAQLNEQGEIVLVADTVTLEGTATLDASASSDAFVPNAPSHGGTVTIEATDTRLSQDSNISVAGNGTGNGGTISITGKNSLLLRGNLNGASGAFGGENGTLNITGRQVNLVNVETEALNQLDVDSMTTFQNVNVNTREDITVVTQVDSAHLNQGHGGGSLTLNAGSSLAVNGGIGDNNNRLDATVTLSGNDGVGVAGTVNAKNVVLHSRDGRVSTVVGGTVSGDNVFATADGGIDLTGHIDSITVVSGNGNINVTDQSGGLRVQHAHASNGDVSFDCNGELQLGHAAAGGYAFAPGDNAQFTSNGGNIVISLVDANGADGFIVRDANGNVVYQHDGGSQVNQVELNLGAGDYTIETSGSGYVTVAGRVTAPNHTVSLSADSITDLHLPGSSAIIDILAADVLLAGQHTTAQASLITPNTDTDGIEWIPDMTNVVISAQSPTPTVPDGTVDDLINNLLLAGPAIAGGGGAGNNSGNGEAIRRAKNLPVCQ